MRRTIRKLSLTGETIRELRTTQLDAVAGGVITGSCFGTCWPDCTEIPPRLVDNTARRQRR